jgi:hypothetical protein
MPLVVAIVPEADQALAISSLARGLNGVELLIGDSARTLVTRLGDRIPDLVLISPLIPAADETLIGALLRQRGSAAAHVQIVTIPLLDLPQPAAPTGLLSPIRSAPSTGMPRGCAPEVFAEQIREYLDLAANERRRLDAVAARQQSGIAGARRSDAPEDAA